MEPVEVTARYDTDGKVTPLRFSWQGREYQVEGTGRRWHSDDGLHLMVMAAGERVFELLFVPQDSRWFIKPRGLSANRLA
jgi:hypothetical protein